MPPNKVTQPLMVPKGEETIQFIYYGFIKNPVDESEVYFKWQAQTILEILSLQKECQEHIRNGAVNENKFGVFLAEKDQFVNNKLTMDLLKGCEKVEHKVYPEYDHFPMV